MPFTQPARVTDAALRPLCASFSGEEEISDGVGLQKTMKSNLIVVGAAQNCFPEIVNEVPLTRANEAQITRYVPMLQQPIVTFLSDWPSIACHQSHAGLIKNNPTNLVSISLSLKHSGCRLVQFRLHILARITTQICNGNCLP